MEKGRGRDSSETEVMERLEWARVRVAVRVKREKLVVMLGKVDGEVDETGLHFRGLPVPFIFPVEGEVPLRQMNMPALRKPGREGDGATQRRMAMRMIGWPKTWQSGSEKWWFDEGVNSSCTAGTLSTLTRGQDS